MSVTRSKSRRFGLSRKEWAKDAGHEPLTEAQRLIRREQAKALEDLLAGQLRYRRVAEPEREYAFAPPRRWRFDFAWPARLIAAEVEGGTWSEGRHVTGAGFERDCLKYNAAAAAGWRVFRFTANHVKCEEAANVLERVLSGR